MRGKTTMTWFARVGLCCAVLLASAHAAQAQTLEPPRARQGYYITLGTGMLALAADDRGTDRGPWIGSLTTIRFGQLLTERFALGLDIEFGGAQPKPREAQLGGLAIEASYAVAGNFALRAMSGFGVLALTNKPEPGYGTRGSGGGFYALGASYDFFPWRKRLTGGWSVTPVAEMRALPGESVTGWIGSIAVEIGWWSGLPKDQLDLPPEEAWKKRNE